MYAIHPGTFFSRMAYALLHILLIKYQWFVFEEKCDFLIISYVSDWYNYSPVSSVWRELGPVIADKKIPTKLKTKLYTTLVRPVISYGAECWTNEVKEENILEKTEMRMLRRIKGVTVKDKMKSKDIRKELGV